MCCLRTEDMMIRLFVVMMIPALCLGSCCVDLMGAPPQFMLSAPPRPPGVVIDLPCPAGGDFMWTDYKPGHDTGPDKIPDGNIGNEANWTGGVHRNTSTSPTLSAKKTIPVGMIVGIVIGSFLIILVVLLFFIVTRCRRIKCEVEPDTCTGHRKHILRTGNDKIRSWFTSRNNNLFKGTQKTGSSISTTSSESGYCEEAVENPESECPSKVVTRRNKPRGRQRPISSRPVVMTEATPDIIASTQKDMLDDGTPKRWSIFGLIPSLKPLLKPSPGVMESKDTEDDEPAASDTTLLNTTPAPVTQHSDNIPMNVMAELLIHDPPESHAAGQKPTRVHQPRFEPTRAQQPRFEPTRAHHPRPEPARAHHPRPDSNRAPPPRPEPIRVRPTRALPAKPEPIRALPARSEPIRARHPRPNTPDHSERVRCSPAPDHPMRDDSRHKKSRVRIRSEGHDPEIEV